MDVALITPYGSNKLVPSSSRTNTAAWLKYGQDAIIQSVEERIAELTGTPRSHQVESRKDFLGIQGFGLRDSES
jgi:hypothetical protein